jgi:predicted Fe-Mo cluster-binding NifX family protein
LFNPDKSDKPDKEHIKMKIAVTSQGETLESNLDPRFGRAAYIIVADTQTLEFEAFDNNKNKNAFKGAGIQAAAMVSNADAEVLLTGFCGPNAFKTLDAASIKVVNDQTGRVIDVIQKFKQGNVIFADGANKDGHW